MTAPELDIRVPLATLAQFSADGQVYRAFAHAIAVLPSLVAMVPIALIDGDLTVVIDRCPIPWQEADAILDDEGRKRRAVPDEYDMICCMRFRDLAPTNWDVDEVELNTGILAARLTHPSGIRLATTLADLQGAEHLFGIRLG